MRPSQKLILSFVASAAMMGTVAVAAPVLEGGTRFVTTLSGASEVPPTTETATGEATITVNPGQGRICWEITTSGFGASTTAITGAHIHPGFPGQNGGISVHLSAVINGTTNDCTETVSPGGAPLPRDLLDAIRKSPQGFYVNIHTNLFPGGAIRGQLSK